jgi:hypothetical protein
MMATIFGLARMSRSRGFSAAAPAGAVVVAAVVLMAGDYSGQDECRSGA